MNPGVERFEVAIEQTLERSVAAAERTIVRRFGAGVLRALRTVLKLLFWTAVFAYFVFGALLLATRYWVLPNLDGWRSQIETLASEALRAPVSIGGLRGSWRAFNPHLVINDVRIAGPGGAEALALPRVEATVSWASLFTLQPRFVSLTVLAPEIEVVLLPGLRYSVAGFIFEPSAKSDESVAADWILAQNRIAVRDARVHYRDERSAQVKHLDLSEVDFLLEQRFGVHRFGLQATPTAAVAAPIDVRGRFQKPRTARASEIVHWRGEVYAQLEYADIAFLAQLTDVPVVVDHAHGALRAWVAFNELRMARVTADLALKDVDVTLSTELEPLRLASLQGRISQHIFSHDSRAARGGDQVSVKGLTFTTATSRFAPLDLTVRHMPALGHLPEETSVDADHIDLTSLAALAPHLPLTADLRDALARHAFRGTLTEVTARWEGRIPAPSQLALKAKFSGLASAGQPIAVGRGERPRIGLPGFENLSGAVELLRGSGRLQLASKDAVLIFPGVFAQPRLRLDELSTELRWRSEPELEVRLESAQASNADADLLFSGTYRASTGGPGWVDLTGKLTRGEMTAAYRYLPLAAGEDTLNWLEHALVAGRVSDASFRLRGDLSRFPFRKGDGEFRVRGRVADGALDVWPARGKHPLPGSIWPLLTGINAELLFERASMTITAQRAEAMGARIGTTVASIADLDHDPTLEISGQASGPLSEMLRYANASPVVRWTDGVTQRVSTTGPARIDLRLRIPLEHADKSTVAGTVHLKDNDVTLKDLPPFTRATGALQFDERGIRINSIAAGFVGGQTRIDAETRADGAHLFSATGSVTPAALKRIVPAGPATRLLNRAQGTARYQARLVVKDGTELSVDSDLVGLSLDGVEPLQKSAQEALPLRFELTPVRNGRDELRVSAGTVLAVHLQRQHDQGTARILRGVVALNEAPNLPDSGLLLLAKAPRLDIEAWSALLAPAAQAGAGTGNTLDPQVDAIALHTPELVIYGRTFGNVTLGATRVAGGGYDANVQSDHAVGHIAWRPAAAGGAHSLGHINARLARLIIPESRKDDIIDVLRAPPKQIPALEVNVEQFELGEMKLGRLELSASNVGRGPATVWDLRRLNISNPDFEFTAAGEWGPSKVDGGARRMQMRFVMDALDAGGSLPRLGYPATMSAGRGRLEGDLYWLGSPINLDPPTLSGNVAVALDHGRFLKVDPGNAGRLLSLLSLQSLSRSLAADGGRQFAEGFAYSSLRADAKISQGVLATENFRMVGDNAVVLMSGTADLRNETQAMHVVVLPEIDASTAALALGVANPILGLGTWLAQRVLRDPLSKAFSLEYDVTGPWAEPKVVRRQRVDGALESLK